MNKTSRASFPMNLVLMAFALSAATGTQALAQPVLNLPTTPVTPTITFSTTIGSLPPVNGFSAYDETVFSGLPSGLSVVNGQTYLTWCVDFQDTIVFSNSTN